MTWTMERSTGSTGLEYFVMENFFSSFLYLSQAFNGNGSTTVSREKYTKDENKSELSILPPVGSRSLA